jgi:uncharacterized membrane protein YqjE
MSFGGHVQDMINRVKFNEDQKKDRKKLSQKMKESFLNSSDRKHSEFIDKVTTQEELEAIKLNIQKEAKSDNRKVNIVFLFIGLVVILIALLLLA